MFARGVSRGTLNQGIVLLEHQNTVLSITLTPSSIVSSHSRPSVPSPLLPPFALSPAAHGPFRRPPPTTEDLPPAVSSAEAEAGAGGLQEGPGSGHAGAQEVSCRLDDGPDHRVHGGEEDVRPGGGVVLAVVVDEVDEAEDGSNDAAVRQSQRKRSKGKGGVLQAAGQECEGEADLLVSRGFDLHERWDRQEENEDVRDDVRDADGDVTLAELAAGAVFDRLVPAEGEGPAHGEGADRDDDAVADNDDAGGVRPAAGPLVHEDLEVHGQDGELGKRDGKTVDQRRRRVDFGGSDLEVAKAGRSGANLPVKRLVPPCAPYANKDWERAGSVASQRAPHH